MSGDGSKYTRVSDQWRFELRVHNGFGLRSGSRMQYDR